MCAYLHYKKFNDPEKPILLVICPLSALVESHIQKLANYGILSCYLGDDGLIEEDISQHSIVFTSPELIVREERWGKLLQSQEFRDNLFGLVTANEAHVVPKW